jgi:uncharacterized repeat protein (TIGR03803 family)
MTKKGADRTGMASTARLALSVGLASLALAATRSAQAQSFTVLYDFSPPGPTFTSAGFIADPAGNLYSASQSGGTYGNGTIYELPAPNYSSPVVLYNFTGGTDGASPEGPLVRDPSGNLYGTTTFGGVSNCPKACGVVFVVSTQEREKVLYAFTGGADGGGPIGGLVRDPDGNSYGTASLGGAANGCGGYGCGVIFELDRSGNETVLYTFSGGTDGGDPYAGLARDAAGNLYGTTMEGGSISDCDGLGCGVVFKLDPLGNETVLYTFSGGSDGGEPGAGALLLDGSGNLYGTAEIGGDSPSCTYGGGCGVIYEVNPTGVETVLHAFGGNDGRLPEFGLVRDDKGNLYGETDFGGTFCPGGCGIIFRLTAAGSEEIVHDFDGTDGFAPGPLLLFKGFLYGATYEGGTHVYGVAFKLP